VPGASSPRRPRLPQPPLRSPSLLSSSPSPLPPPSPSLPRRGSLPPPHARLGAARPRHGARPRPARCDRPWRSRPPQPSPSPAGAARGHDAARRGARGPLPQPAHLAATARCARPLPPRAAACPPGQGARPPCPCPGARPRPAPAAALARTPSPWPQRAPAPGSLARLGAAAPAGPPMPVARSTARRGWPAHALALASACPSPWLARPARRSGPGWPAHARGAQHGAVRLAPGAAPLLARSSAAARWPTCCARGPGMARGALARPARLEYPRRSYSRP
jgi:hypothetical protein